MRSSVFENNVSRYSVVINTVSDYKISPLYHYIWSGSFLDFSHAVSDPIPDSVQSVTVYESQVDMCCYFLKK